MDLLDGPSGSRLARMSCAVNIHLRGISGQDDGPALIFIIHLRSVVASDPSSDPTIFTPFGSSSQRWLYRELRRDQSPQGELPIKHNLQVLKKAWHGNTRC